MLRGGEVTRKEIQTDAALSSCTLLTWRCTGSRLQAALAKLGTSADQMGPRPDRGALPVPCSITSPAVTCEAENSTCGQTVGDL